MSGQIDLREFVSGFVAESHELLRGVHVNLLAVDAAVAKGDASPRPVRELFRALHTMKGLAGMIGVEPIVEIAHAMESVLRLAERAGGRLPRDAFGPLLEATQAIEHRVTALAEKRAVKAVPARIIEALERLEQGDPAVSAPRAVLEIDPSLDAKLDASDRALLAGAEGRGQHAYQLAFSPSPERAAAGLTITSVRERIAAHGEIVKVVPTSVPRVGGGSGLRFVLLAISGATREALRDATGLDDDDVAALPVTEPPPAAVGDPTDGAADEEPSELLGTQGGVVRVDVRRLDDAMDGLAELLVSRRRLVLAVDALAASGVDVRALRQVVLETTRQLRDMRRAVVSLRMVSIAELCEPLALLVRGLTATTGRSVRLELDLGRVEIDKAVGERIWPALVHLVRNAVDHGIESAEVRAAAGKPAVGRLVVRASQRTNALVEIQLEDDGGGVDAVEVARRAGAPFPTDDAALLDLLARPGLSTRAVADATSGRGMGIDIVRKTIAEELGGDLLLRTRRSEGTTFILRVPVTVAIMDALAFETDSQPFLVAVAGVETLADVDPRDVTEAPAPRKRSHEVPVAMLRHGESVVPLFDLGRVLTDASSDVASDPPAPRSTAPRSTAPRKAILVRRPRGLVAFAVDRMLGHHEVVVRPLVDPLVKVRGITGTTDLGDGKPTLILDLAALADDRVDHDGGPGVETRAGKGRAA